MATAITALLVLSMFAAAVPAFAATDTFTATIVDPSPATGAVGTKVNLSVIGASAGGQILVYWENTGGDAITNATTFASGAGTATIIVTIPEAAAGVHYLIVKDVAYGATTSAAFTISPKIVLSPSRGIPGDVVTVTGTGFGASKNVTASFNGVEKGWGISSSTGGVTITFTVPTVAYGTYAVTAADNATTPNIAPSVDFIVGASVTISPNSGPAGTIVTVTGRGFTNTAGLLVAITIGGVTPANLTTMRTAADGTFTGTFVVPSSLAVSNSRYTVTATDSAATPISGSTSGLTGGFKVTGTTKITTVTSAAPGASINLSGVNFTAQAGTVVTIKFGLLDPYATFTTDANGAFSGILNVPYVTTGDYNIVATDANGLTYTITAFKVAITSLSVTPSTAPSGTLVTVNGYGFGASKTFNVTFAGVLVATGTVSATTPTVLTATFIIPTINPNTYSITAMDADGLTATTEFTVNATSTLTVNPSTSPKNIAVTITATNFGDASTLTFFIYNSTWSSALTVTEAATYTAYTTKANGKFVGTFTISASNIALGAYTINASNTNSPANRFNATVSFTLGSATLDVNTRASSYRQGDILSFKITSSYAADVTITIVDPEGVPAIIPIDGDWFVQVGNVYVLSYAKDSNQAYYGDQWATFTIPTDAPTGTWCWNTTEIQGLKRTGEFTVVSNIGSTIDTINTKLDSMNVTLVAVKDNVLTIKTSTGTITTTLTALDAKIVAIQGKVATIETNIGTMQTSISSLPSSVSSSVQTSISNGMATISTSIGTVNTKLDSIDAVLGAVAGDVVTINTSVGDITTTLTAINAKVVSIEGDVATIQTDLGTLQGAVTELHGDVATIQTGVGTVQVDVSNLQPKVQAANDTTSSMSTMIYVAVAFAIIAAIAAVASILLMRKKIAS